MVAFWLLVVVFMTALISLKALMMSAQVWAAAGRQRACGKAACAAFGPSCVAVQFPRLPCVQDCHAGPAHCTLQTIKASCGPSQYFKGAGVALGRAAAQMAAARRMAQNVVCAIVVAE